MASATDHRQTGAVRAAAHIARATLAEAIRLRLLWFVAASAALLVVSAFWLRDLHFGVAEARFLFDLSFAAIGLGATCVATLGTAQLFFSDLDHRLVAFVLSRPVSRAAWLGGKLGGALAALALFTGVLGLLAAALLAWRSAATGFVLPWWEIAVGTAALWLKAALAAAATLLVCTYARSPAFASGAGFLFVVIGHLRPIADGIPGEFSFRGIVGTVIRLWPDLGRLDPTIAGRGPGSVDVAYGLGCLAVLFLAGSLSFRQRDL